MPIKALLPCEIMQGDVLARLRELPDQCAHCCVTSPPYWGLRDYGVDGQLGRNGIGIELNPEYVKLARERIGKAEKPQTFVSAKESHATLSNSPSYTEKEA